MFQMNQLVSIVIPTYNRENLIAETLDSALAQTHKNLEVIVSDNASTDRTASIVETYARRDSRVKLFQNSRNLGPVLNWKAGLGKASGEYVKILWSDDLISPEFLEKTLELFAEKPDMAFVFTKVSVGRNSASARLILYDHFAKTGIYPAVEFIRGIVRGDSLPYSPGCALFRTDILKRSFVTENSLFPNRYLQNGAGPDLLMLLMAAQCTANFGYVNEPLSFFREHDDSITMSSNAMSLGLDYAKAVVWYLDRYVNRDTAVRYWMYVFRKRKLYKRKNRGYLVNFLFKDQEMRYFQTRFLVYAVESFLLRSKSYRKRIKIT